MKWYYANGDDRVGPVSESDRMEAVRDGKIQPETLVWREGMPSWVPYKEVAQDLPAPAPREAVAPADGITCVECGRVFPPSDVVQIGGQWICGACKPLLVQKLKEGLALPGVVRYAGFWIRVGAKIIDGIILAIANMVVSIPLGMLGAVGFNPAAGFNASQIISLALLYAVQISVAAGYAIFFVGKYGATPGKMACGIRIVRPDGSALTYGRATGRYFAEWVTNLTLGIGYIIVAFDDEKRALHDYIADTRVIYK